MRQHTNSTKRQEYQDLYNSSVAIRLREKHREVNEGRPFESRLQIEVGNNNHSFHIGSATDLDCCFMAIHLLGTQNYENTLEQLA